MKIGYGKNVKEIAKFCWDHNLSSRHDFPERTKTEVLTAVAEVWNADSSDYENMMAANRILGWIKREI